MAWLESPLKVFMIIFDLQTFNALRVTPCSYMLNNTLDRKSHLTASIRQRRCSKIPKAERWVSNMCSESFLGKQNKLELLNWSVWYCRTKPSLRGRKHSRSFLHGLWFGCIFVDLMNVLFSGISSFLLQLTQTRTSSLAAVITTTATRGHRLTTNINMGRNKMLSHIRPFFWWGRSKTVVNF